MTFTTYQKEKKMAYKSGNYFDKGTRLTIPVQYGVDLEEKEVEIVGYLGNDEYDLKALDYGNRYIRKLKKDADGNPELALKHQAEALLCQLSDLELEHIIGFAKEQISLLH